MEGLKNLLAPKTLHWFSYVANVCWIVLGIILSAIFLDIENSEPRFDFRCGSNGDKELIRGQCYEQYEKQYNKFPVYGFVMINFLVTASVCGIYSQAVKSKVEELENNARNGDDDVEGQPTPRKKLFKAYCLQLLVRFALGISFVLLQTKLLYPPSFPSNFKCNLTREEKFSDITASGSRNGTQTQTSYECHNQRAAKKSFWSDAVIVVTGTFAFFVFIESLFMLLWRARKVSSFKAFTEDQKFHKYYLSSNSANDEQTSVSTFIANMKEHVKRKTERSDDKDPFCPKPGEGSQRDQTLDQIYTNLVIHKGRVNMHDLIAGGRKKRLEEYPTPTENSQPTQPGDIFDAQKLKILVVGRPGIGKTMFSTKILRNWASGNLFIEAKKSLVDFEVAFLIKLRRFNSAKQDEKLSLRELLNQSEYSAEDLTEEVWKYILQNPNKVLIIFDGFDEYSGKTKIDNESHPYRDNEQESMPIHFLFKKIASGDILRGATVLTTTRPNAVSCISRLHFDKTVEILGFTTEQVDEYVQKFTNGDDQKANTIKQHINGNRNLLSFCYIPVNCWIICSCLLQLLGNTTGLTSLPTRLTEIYSIAIKMFYFCYDDNQYRHDKAKGQPFILKPFKELSSHVQNVFARLGKIAFDGIKEGRLIFESHEVNDLESNGLFHRLPDTRDRPLAEPRPQYCFLHLTIQEFLAAKYLVDTYSSEDLQKFVSDHIQDGAWKVVMQFVAGLLAEKEGQSTDIFSDLLPSETFTEEVEIKMNEDSEERIETLTFWPVGEDRFLVVTLFNCMYENKASDQEVQKKLAKIGCNALSFRMCNLSPLDCLALVHALKSVEGILHFDLRFNKLQSRGCIEIAKLLPGNQHNQGFCELKRLNLDYNNITDEAVKHLATALTHTNCKLNSLNLNSNNITDKAVKHLCTALAHNNCKLNRLDLYSNNITDKAVKHLCTALAHTNCKLNSLHLRYSNITDKGKNLLNSMNINYQSILRFLNLKLNKITYGCIKRFTGSTALTHTKCKKLRP
ncbi:unnamed protein product [Porites evermanni]|uniref:NACHT domain-containing protein n=1 Tax=Porites evermanni TaxID=104178 RepID=A0ABN8R0D1_9CNID|nr:unnamed protein product [Porites evermanni]